MKLPALLVDHLNLPAELRNALPIAWTKGSTLKEKSKVSKRPPSKPRLSPVAPVAPSKQDKSGELSVDMLTSAFGGGCRVKAWETSNLEFVEQLQEASRNHGSVDLMKQLDGGSMVAVKKMPNRWVTAGPKEFREQHPTAIELPWLDIGIVKHLNNVNFPYACQLHDVFRDNAFTYVAVSLASEGDLLTWCQKGPIPGAENEVAIRPIAKQIFEAVRMLHNLGIAHRDLSMENILLTKNRDGSLHVKVIDFGMATTQRKCILEVRGKKAYHAPEMHEDTFYDPFVTDAFAIGVILYGMAAHDYPWVSTELGSCDLYDYISIYGLRSFLQRRKARNGGGYLSQVLSGGLVEALEGFLERQPERRLTLGESCWGYERRSVWALPWVNGGAVDSRR